MKTEIRNTIKNYPTYIIDTETGGFDPYRNSLLTLALLNEQTGEVKVWEFKPYPSQTINTSALNINKINVANLNKQRNSQNLLAIISELASPIVHLVGHNIEFDIKFLIETAKKEKMEKQLPTIIYTDTLELAKKHLKKTGILKQVNLESVYNHFQAKTHPDQTLDQTLFHTAEGDVIATSKIFRYLLRLEEVEE